MDTRKLAVEQIGAFCTTNRGKAQPVAVLSGARPDEPVGTPAFQHQRMRLTGNHD